MAHRPVKHRRRSLPSEAAAEAPQRTIAAESETDVERAAAELGVKRRHVREAVEQVGPNRTAVELWLTAPRR